MERNEQIEPLLATVHTLLRAEGADESADVVRSYHAKAEQSGFDNWNGGTNYWVIQSACLRRITPVSVQEEVRWRSKSPPDSESLRSMRRTIAIPL